MSLSKLYFSESVDYASDQISDLYLNQLKLYNLTLNLLNINISIQYFKIVLFIRFYIGISIENICIISS